MSQRILQLSIGLDVGGVEEVLRLMAAGLDRKRYEIVACTFEPGRVSRQIEADGHRVEVVSIEGVRGLRRQWRKTMGLFKTVAKLRPALIHNHNCLQLAGVLLLRRWLPGRPRTVLSVHQFAPWTGWRGWLYGRWVASHDRVLPVSHPAKQWLIDRYRVDPGKLIVHHNTVEDRPFLESKTDARLSLGVEPDAFLIATVGRLVDNKHVDLLVDTVAKLHPDFPRMRLSIVGKGPERDALARRIARLGAEDYIRIEGYVENLATIYRAADVHVSMGSAETFSLVTLEAMSQASAAIACVPNGVSDVIEEGLTGYLIPAKDGEALADRLVRLAGTPGLAERMGAAGRARYLEHFHISRHAGRLAKIYDSLLSVVDSRQDER
ncbi:MAG TPA: glycosyltransferase family 4 protein [Luteolibacter sp.]